jgi:hypothetical protein
MVVSCGEFIDLSSRLGQKQAAPSERAPHPSRVRANNIYYVCEAGAAMALLSLKNLTVDRLFADARTESAKISLGRN